MQSQQDQITQQGSVQYTNGASHNSTDKNTRPGTPPRPPYSPVTPVFAQLAPNASHHPIVPPPVDPPSSASPTCTNHTQPQYHQPKPSAPPTTTAQPIAPTFATGPPPPVPISESDNPDAIALRSAISILQLQKQQSLRDIHALDRMKRAAAADPERFASVLVGGELSAHDRGGFIDVTRDMEVDKAEDNGDGGSDSQGRRQSDDTFANLGKIPTPQNVVRMPPINWAKYQIVGEPLDKMHAEQLRRPTTGEPDSLQRAPEHALASPYRPLVDKLETGKMKGNRKKS